VDPCGQRDDPTPSASDSRSLTDGGEIRTGLGDAVRYGRAWAIVQLLLALLSRTSRTAGRVLNTAFA
jgi:hypothetical protein